MTSFQSLAVLIILLLPLIFLIPLTKIDVKTFKNLKTRSKVVEKITPKMPDKQLFKLFLKQNLRELSLFYIGVIFGLLIVFLG